MYDISEKEVKEQTTPTIDAQPADTAVETDTASEAAQTENADGAARSENEAQSDAPQPPEEVDYDSMAREDLLAIKQLCPDLAAVSHLHELPFAKRFAQLRDLGLSVRESLAAAMPDLSFGRGKGHLRTDVPRGNSLPEGSLSGEDLRAAKELFYGLSEKEINALYRRVCH